MKETLSLEHESSQEERCFAIGGVFQYRILNADGSLYKDWEKFKNGVPNAALNDVLQVYLGNGTQKTTWYIGLIDNSGFSSLSQNDTIASHTGWSESTAYNETVRQTCTFGTASGQVINNVASLASFTINTTVAVNGAFLVSNNTKGGTSGLLFATGSFASVQNLSNGQVLQVRYDCSAAST
jgi:hypothetical protein